MEAAGLRRCSGSNSGRWSGLGGVHVCESVGVATGPRMLFGSRPVISCALLFGIEKLIVRGLVTPEGREKGIWKCWS